MSRLELLPVGPGRASDAMQLTRRELLEAGALTGACLLVRADARPTVHDRPGTGVVAATRARGLPGWFDANRVQGHTRLSLRPWHGQPEFIQAAAGFKALGAGAFTRHFKSADEDPWWSPTARPNVAQEMIDEAHREGLKIIAYYWHMSEQRVAESHPDWICRHPDGTPILHDPRGIHLDITGPYGEVVLRRLRQLARMGVDGFFFDEQHLPPEGCWCSALEQAWRVKKGQSAPTVVDDTDSTYRRFIDFKAQMIEETFAYWRSEVQARYPEVVFIVSTTTVAALTDRQMTTRLARVADSPKSEYGLAFRPNLNKNVFNHEPGRPDLATLPNHVRQAIGWTLLRDAADGRAPHIWASGLPNCDHALGFAASLLTFGCVANMDVSEPSLIGGDEQTEGKTPLDGIKAAFALGDAVSPHLAGARPLRWAAVHFSECRRNAREADYRAAWRQVLWPLVGAYKVLAEAGLPVGVVTDSQLEHNGLDGYQLLVLPNRDELTRAQQRAVQAFVARGGAVIANDPTWPWSDPVKTDEAATDFRGALRLHVRGAPVIVTGGPASRYAVSYRKRDQLIVAVTNDFSWVQTQSLGNPLQPGEIKPRAPDAADVQVTWRIGHGLPERSRRWGTAPLPRAFDAVSRRHLNVEEVQDGYRVTLETFAFMALLVVTDAR